MGKIRNRIPSRRKEEPTLIVAKLQQRSIQVQICPKTSRYSRYLLIHEIINRLPIQSPDPASSKFKPRSTSAQQESFHHSSRYSSPYSSKVAWYYPSSYRKKDAWIEPCWTYRLHSDSVDSMGNAFEGTIRRSVTHRTSLRRLDGIEIEVPTC